MISIVPGAALAISQISLTEAIPGGFKRNTVRLSYRRRGELEGQISTVIANLCVGYVRGLVSATSILILTSHVRSNKSIATFDCFLDMTI